MAQTTQRPQRRPANLQVQAVPVPRARPQQLAAPQQQAAPAPAPATPGVYPNLGIRDETAEFGDLASGERTEDIDGIIVHRTESPTMESTRNAYRTQIENGNHVGAHYLIGQDGETSLTVPTDQRVSHARGNKEKSYQGSNGWTVGIENVGMATSINPRGDIRAQVEALTLPPAMRARLLAMDDKTLKNTLADSENEIHTDITGAQKRANWNLINALSAEHELEPGDVRAHEDVDYKTLGEGEPITEFLAAMRERPQQIAALEARVAELQRSGGDPARLAQLQALLAEERATQAAVAVDKTRAENNALEGEKVLGQPGAATAREADRTQFYDQFWARTQRLRTALAPQE